MNPVELAANAFNAASVFLAGRNSIHMWWTTIVNCVLFAYVFFHARLYADVTLHDAPPLLALAREDAVVAQYLRCVGREGRPLLNLERIALYGWVEEGRREQIGAG